jgi:hypothetical protein
MEAQFYKATVVASYRRGTGLLDAGARVAVRVDRERNEVAVMAGTPWILTLSEAQSHLKTDRPLVEDPRAGVQWEAWYNGD